jgi:hypothetical protein
MNFIRKSFLVSFHIRKASDLALLRFARDHREKLNANNPGNIYDADITALDAAVTGFTTKYDEEDLKVTDRQSKTITVDDWKEQAEDFFSEAEGLISYTFRAAPEDYEKFYPHGITEYYKATREELDRLLLRFREVAEEYQEVLPTEVITEISRIQSGYHNALSAQTSQKGQVSESRQASDLTRITLEDQVMKNMYAVARNNLRHPEVASVYFDASIILPFTYGGGGNVFSETIEPMATEVITQGSFTPEGQVDLQNRGQGALLFYLAARPADPVPATAFEVLSNTLVRVTMQQLGNPADTFLMVHNPDTGLTGRFTVSFIEEM